MALFGILNVNKPAGPTSRDVVNRALRLTRPAKAGHAGTLDPLATGVLVICVGQATRLIQYVQRMPKTYRATFLLGRRSDTDDIEGQVVPVENAPQPTRDDVEQALPRFLGEIQQRPPAHSAIKIAGRPAYERARRGETIEMKPRSVAIHRLAIREYEYPELKFDVECGSGTYVRALGRDIAAALGTAAVMSALERTAIGTFRVEDAVALTDLADTLPQHLQPALAAVADLRRIVLDDAQLVEIHHGRPIAMPTVGAGGPPAPTSSEYAATDATAQLVAILHEKHAGQLWPKMNFR